MIIHVDESEKLYMRLDLRFFDEGEKTEQPTAKKKNKARSEGQVAKSPEITTAFMFIIMFSALRSYAPGMFTKMISIYRFGFVSAGDMGSQLDHVHLSKYINHMFLQAIVVVIPILIMAMLVGVITNFVQVGWHPTTKPMKPKLSKLNPLSGIKRLFSFRAVLDLLKSMAKFILIIYVIYSAIAKNIEYIPLLAEMDVIESLIFIGNIAVDLGVRVGMMFIIVAAVDFIYTRYKHNKELKMTKHEVKEEYKQAEGNPQIKGKIRSKMREISMRRMMQGVPQADVIITNPTHYAVALKYDREESTAPILIAKGADYLARRIKDVGKENGVQIVENKQLARTIYANVEIGREIPPELYQAVAEILAFVYKLKSA